jgi:hypothetical protein
VSRDARAVHPGPVTSVAVVGGGLALLAVTLASGIPAPAIGIAILVAVAVVSAYRFTLSWRGLVGVTVLVIFFIPIRRYTIGGGLPFDLEPYRLVVAFAALGWTISLLVDPRVRARRSGLEAPLALFVVAAIGSILTNWPRVNTIEAEVVKKFTYWGTFVIVLFLVVSVVRTLSDVDIVVKLLVICGGVIAAAAIVEANTGFNAFNHLARVLPFLGDAHLPDTQERGGRLRTYASAQHAIELGAILVMILPLTVYLVQRTAHRRWWIATALMLLGALATVSRTTILMLLVVAAVFLWLRPVQTRRLWPAVLPLLVATNLLLPGTLGSFKQSFFPAGGLIAEQSVNPGWRGSGRLADLGPSLAEFSDTPLVGQGFGTRIVNGPQANAPILDDQWLVTLLETGAVGTLAWIWILVRAIRRTARAAREDDSARGWLLVSLTGTMLAFAVGMFTFDAFSFEQATFMFFIQLALAAVLTGPAPARGRRRARPS